MIGKRYKKAKCRVPIEKLGKWCLIGQMRSLFTFLLFVAVQSSQAAPIGSTFNIYFSDAGNGSTAASWNVIGDLVGSGIISNYQTNAWGGQGGWAGQFSSGIFTASIPTGFNEFTLNGGVGGTSVNQNGSGASGSGTYPSSASITKIALYDGGSFNYVGLNFGNLLGYSRGNTIVYTPAQDSGTIAVPFSSFNAGTYQYVDSGGGIGFTTPITYNLTVSSVPEPSSLSLLAVGLGGLAMMGRRRS